MIVEVYGVEEAVEEAVELEEVVVVVEEEEVEEEVGVDTLLQHAEARAEGRRVREDEDLPPLLRRVGAHQLLKP